tara:strand:+ start:326 stop:571 length:246 start_codon:yes stop_codon:yes gene_type:complete
MKAEKYLESIGLENVIDEEFFNDDDKSWYKVQELMEAYHQAKLDLLTIPVVSKAFYCLEGGIKGSEHVCKKQCDSCNRFQQ